MVMMVAWRIVPRMQHPLFAEKFALPDRTDLTPKLIIGSMLFGMGWGIAGLCPGPGFAVLAIAPAKAAIFVVALLGGMLLQRLIFERGT